MICLSIEAPFAVFRPFAAGWFRATAPFLTHSAAYGLLLNIAGIESRLMEHEEGYPAKSGSPATLMRPGLPEMRLAVGAFAKNGTPDLPGVESLYQQLHNYPVGNSGAELAALGHGQKYNITPVRRQVLTGLRALVAAEADEELLERIQRGLRGEWNDGGTQPHGKPRYGLPFLGDNSFLPSRLDLLAEPPEVHWFSAVPEDATLADGPSPARLTSWIDRAGMAGTRSALFAPEQAARGVPPESAWVSIPPQT